MNSSVWLLLALSTRKRYIFPHGMDSKNKILLGKCNTVPGWNYWSPCCLRPDIMSIELHGQGSTAKIQQTNYNNRMYNSQKTHRYQVEWRGPPEKRRWLQTFLETISMEGAASNILEKCNEEHSLLWREIMNMIRRLPSFQRTLKYPEASGWVWVQSAWTHLACNS